ncbi:MAG: zinc metallopeptidase [Candidatus Competibacteraceae bacterium]|nr:zinc metallopeptidase [Candidatus Competibacteraceae bacterium]
MYLLIPLLLLLTLLVGPGLWARQVLERYRAWTGFPGSGEQFARHLLERLKLTEVRVETTPGGDHYDPRERVVRLNEATSGERSLTAIVVAAHEVGHALQHAQNFRPLEMRAQLVALAQRGERLGSLALVALPVATALTRSPGVGLLMAVAGFLVLALPALVHLITLPVEWDASFRRALPILQAGGYLDERQMPAARRILTACALTYLAGSLISLLNVWRWLRVLRR